MTICSSTSNARRSPTLTKLKLHIATHINVKPYMCSVCGWRANLRWYIQVGRNVRTQQVMTCTMQMSDASVYNGNDTMQHLLRQSLISTTIEQVMNHDHI
jgi:hypothetical protein